MKKTNIFILIGVTTSGFFLSACGGGGGGESPTVSVDPIYSYPSPPALIANPSDFETTEYAHNYALNAMNASAAYARGATGNGIVVAVIDSGVLADHVDLSGQIDVNSIDIIDQVQPLTDTDGHGTNIAGVIAGIKNNSGVHGLAYESTVLAIRANERSTGNPSVDDCGNGASGCAFAEANLAIAVNYAVDHGAKIINISLGGGKTNSPAFEAALTRAVQAGVIIVASAGNDYGLIDHDNNVATADIINPDALTPDAPANFAGAAEALGRALAVGASDQNNLIASFSNRAGSGAVRNFYLVAPGVDVITTGLDTANPSSRSDYFQVSGTSFSSAYVSAAIALLLDAYPTLQPEDAVSLLVETATDLGASGVDDTYGAGIVNLATAFSPVGVTRASFQGQAVAVDLSGFFEAPQGALGDWAEKGGAFVNLVFQDKYKRNFRTNEYVQEVNAAARGVGLLQSYTDRIDQNYASSSFAVDYRGEKARVKLSINQNKLWQKGVWRDQLLGMDSTDWKREKGNKTDVEIIMHLGAFHFGSGRGFSSPSSGSLKNPVNLYGGIHSLVGEQNWISGGYDFNENYTMGFVSNSSDKGTVGAVNLEKRLGQHSVVAEVGVLNERASFLGSSLAGRFGEDEQGTTLYYALNWHGPLIGEWSGAGRLEFAKGQLDVPNFITVNEKPLATAWSFSLYRPVLNSSLFHVSISQPLRSESGAISFGAPVGVNLETNELIYKNRTLELTPSGREINFKTSFTFPLKRGFSILAEAQYIHNPLHFSTVEDEMISWLSLKGSW